MPALKTLGMLILALVVVSLFLIGWKFSQDLKDLKGAREAVLTIDIYVREVLASGNFKVVNIEIPGGYTIEFEDNQICLGKSRLPEGGYQFQIVGPALGPGHHELMIKIENDVILVTEWTSNKY
jgi:hypothetical protein